MKPTSHQAFSKPEQEQEHDTDQNGIEPVQNDIECVEMSRAETVPPVLKSQRQP